MKNAISLVFVLGCVSAFAAELDPKGLGFDPFVPFAQLKAKELCPPSAGLSVSPEGHLLWNGKPHYFTATIWYGATELECNEDTPGYVDELKWLYQKMPGYEELQRLGLDAGGIEAPLNWTQKYAPWGKKQRRDDVKLGPSVTNGLPLYVDYTASEWSHGWMGSPRYNVLDPDEPGDPKDGHVAGEKGRLPKEAFAPAGHHFMPYSILNEKGRKIWLNMWVDGAKELMELHPVKPWCYELFNEPACSEEGLVDNSLKGVDRIKFIEERFASICAEGQEALRKIDPNALACFQPTTMRTRGIDLYRANEKLGVVCAPTGGHGGAVEAHLLRALADGKPIVDSEMYVGCSTNSIRQSFMDQYQRGYSVSYMFKWSRRPSDWRVVHEVVQTEGKWKGFKFWQMWPEESLKKVGKVSAYNFMCPYKVSTDQLLGIRLAKRDIQDVNEFFTPRDRGVKREVAVLFSSPTERLAQVSGGGNHRLFDAATSGIGYAHLNPDVIFEPQLTNSLSRLNRYKVLVMAGMTATYPGTWKQVSKWVENGGHLLVFADRADRNEHGEPNPDAPQLQEGTKTVGKGSITYREEKCGALQMAADVVRLGALSGVKPWCEAKDALADDGSAAASLEITPARRGALDAYLVTSRAPTTQVVRFKPAANPNAKNPILVRLWTAPGDQPVPGADPRVRDLVSHRQPLKADKDGSYVFTADGSTQSFVCGDADEILKRYPRAEEGVVWDKGLTAEQALAEGKDRLAREKAERLARQPLFDVDPNRMEFVRLHDFATVQNPGWKIPWGETDCRGMRFNFIRFDQNQFKDMIGLEKPVKGIPVESRAAAVYFLHTAAPAYRVVYEDKKSVTIDPKKCREESWKDEEGHVLKILRWENPNPELKIMTLDISAGKEKAALVAAVTVEKPQPKTVPVETLICKGGGKGVRATVDTNNVWNVMLDETAGSWVCAAVDISPNVSVEPGKYTRLYFEMNRLPDAYGNYHDHATPQLKVNGRGPDGKLAFGNWRVPMYKRGGWAYRADNDPETWETVWIGLDKNFLPDHFRKVISIALQFQMMPAEHSGLAFRNFRFEEAE
jgi:hypothetical protein